MELKEAAAALLAAKQAEAKAKKARLKAEADLVEAFGKVPLEGTVTKATDGYKVSVTGKLNRKLDWPAYQAAALPENLQFVEMAPKIDLKRLRAVEMIDPELVAGFVTVKPGKTGIKVEEVK